MFLWTCADMTPQPLVINYSWWQDRKTFGTDLRISHWPEGYLNLRSGYFVDKKRYCFLLLIRYSSVYFLTKFLRALPEHMEARSLLQTRQVHQLVPLTAVWRSARGIQTFFLLGYGQHLCITQFCLTFMHRPYKGPSIWLPNTFFQLDLRWYADILRHVSMKHKFRPWQTAWNVQWRLFHFWVLSEPKMTVWWHISD